ncbi:hypothetical protein PSYAR_30818, partial [Pseudomonas syringae pv. aceris str. M302273]
KNIGKYNPKQVSNTRIPSSAMRGVNSSCNCTDRAYTRSPQPIAAYIIRQCRQLEAAIKDLKPDAFRLEAERLPSIYAR